jgi:acylphosphatase
MMKACKRVHYHGQVQGVGFRYTTWNVAKHYAVVGYVKNLPNGDVELVAEGDAAEVGRFLKAVAERMAEYITGQAVDDIAEQGFSSFDIQH